MEKIISLVTLMAQLHEDKKMSASIQPRDELQVLQTEDRPRPPEHPSALLSGQVLELSLETSPVNILLQ